MKESSQPACYTLKETQSSWSVRLTERMTFQGLMGDGKDFCVTMSHLPAAASYWVTGLEMLEICVKD